MIQLIMLIQISFLFIQTIHWLKRNRLERPWSLIRRSLYFIVFVDSLASLFERFFPRPFFCSANLYKLTLVFVDVFTRSIHDRNFSARSFVCSLVSKGVNIRIAFFFTRSSITRLLEIYSRTYSSTCHRKHLCPFYMCYIKDIYKFH